MIYTIAMLVQLWPRCDWVGVLPFLMIAHFSSLVVVVYSFSSLRVFQLVISFWLLQPTAFVSCFPLLRLYHCHLRL